MAKFIGQAGKQAVTRKRVWGALILKLKNVRHTLIKSEGQIHFSVFPISPTLARLNRYVGSLFSGDVIASRPFFISILSILCPSCSVFTNPDSPASTLVSSPETRKPFQDLLSFRIFFFSFFVSFSHTSNFPKLFPLLPHLPQQSTKITNQNKTISIHF